MSVKNYQPQQFMLFFSNPKDILGEGHLCFVVDDIIEHIDLSKLPNKRDTVGAPCYDYRLLIKVANSRDTMANSRNSSKEF